jgi:hypothetical protein
VTDDRARDGTEWTNGLRKNRTNVRNGSAQDIRLKYSGIIPMNGRSRPAIALPQRSGKGNYAATVAVHAQRSVLTLSAKTHHSPDTGNPADAGFLRA